MASSTPSTGPSEAERPPSLTLPAQYLKGVGPKRGEVLARLGVRTVADLLFFFPRRYEDFSEIIPIGELEDDANAAVVGRIVDFDCRELSAGRHLISAVIEENRDYLRVSWFNQPYLVSRMKRDQRLLVRGKVKRHAGRFTMNQPQVRWLDDDQDAESLKRLIPVYRLSDGLQQRQIRQICGQAVEEYADLVEEALPQSLRDEAGVCDIQTAIRQIHQPRNGDEALAARARLVYQELLVLQLALALRRQRVRTLRTAPQLELTPLIRGRILSRLPFELSPSQAEAWDEIAADLARPWPMNRLLHGEVGSGKTAVAVCSMLTAVANGYQAAFMAPTEILARQHLRTLQELLAGSRVRVELLTGQMKGTERGAAQARIESGEAQVVIGTHAIVAGSVQFQKLGLVVIDEQHKFGVRQRAMLKQSEHDPHYLVMTATPIPRTVSMTLFGDLDVSVLEKPVGVGSVVHTYLGERASEAQWWEFVARKLREGRQAYVVAPLVETDGDSQLSSAERLFESLANGPLSEFRLDVVHGRQSSEEKDTSLRKFAAGETQVLVATGVIEVGINVPNATVMTIESAERFGLSQLHQLRGRVARGSHPGFVCAFATADDAVSNERLAAFANVTDGFELAETDLRLRGPGDLFSTSQSGFPPLMIADLLEDGALLKRAQRDARAIVERDPQLADPGWSRLKQLVLRRYGTALDLGDVG